MVIDISWGGGAAGLRDLVGGGRGAGGGGGRGAMRGLIREVCDVFF